MSDAPEQSAPEGVTDESSAALSDADSAAGGEPGGELAGEAPALSRQGAMVLVAVAYVAAAVVALLVLSRHPTESPLINMLIADVAATFVVFGFSVGANNSSVYDPYWSVAPIGIALWWFLVEWSVSASGGLLLLAVSAWGIRLTWNFLSGWSGIGHEDWRYVAFRERFGAPLYWLVSLTGIHLFPTLVVFAGMAPAYEAIAVGGPIGPWSIAGLVVCLLATGIEWLSDRQLRAHRASGPPKGSILDSGLWRYSRHPNYFGETLFWWGLWLFALPAGGWWTIFGPLGVTALFLFISVPMTDKKTLESRPHYAAHMERVSGLFPWPPKAAAPEAEPPTSAAPPA